MQFLSSFHHGAINIHDSDEESIRSRIGAMQKQERSGYKCSYYMKNVHQRQGPKPSDSHMCTQDKAKASKRKNQVNEDFRCEIVSWLFSMVEYLELNNETVSIAMSYVDRFLQTDSGIPALSNRRTFQQVAIASFFIAIKLFEPALVDADTMSVCVRGEYTANEIISMETLVLKALQWRVNPPTALAFVHHYLSLCPQEVIPEPVVCALYDAARFQTEIAMKDYFFVAVNRSTIAIASILNAMEGMPDTFLPDSARHFIIQKIMDITTTHDSFTGSLKTKEKLKRGLTRGFNFEVLLLKYSMNSLSFTPKAMSDVNLPRANMPLICTT